MTYVNRFETPTTITGTPSLRTVLSYDDANRLEAITHRAALHEVSAPVLNDYNFVYDDASRIQSIDSLLDGLSVFTFSTDNQLTDADHDPSRDDENYSYDANGNRIGGSYVVDAQNRTASDGTYDYEFDDEGNRTRRTLVADGSFEVNTFDHRNRLTKVEFYEMGDVVGQDDPYQSISYTYDAFNNLVHRTVDTDGNGTANLDQIFAGFDRNQSTLQFDGSETSNLTHRRLWGPLVDQLIASEEVDSLTTPGDVLWALFDQTGTIRDIGQYDTMSNEFEIVSHRVYNSFGFLTGEYDPDTQAPSNVEFDFGFTGKFTDDLTGLTHHQHRWLDPQLGKWINEDPIGFHAGDVNTTRYVANNPLQYVDPNGLYATGIGNYGNGNGDSGNGGTNGIVAHPCWDDSSSGGGKVAQAAEGFRQCVTWEMYQVAKPDGEIGGFASRFARNHFKGPNNVWQRNAARHAMWQIQLHFRFGPDMARAIGESHEAGEDPDDRDHRADVFNNRVAQRMATRLETFFENFRFPEEDRPRYIRDAILNAIERGDFVINPYDSRINE